MKDLVFFTDRYPYNNSEAFIENEIDIMASHFNRVFILPCGLMVDTKTCRKVPKNVRIISPPVQDDIWASRPSRTKKVIWGISHLFPWFVLCLFTKQFYKELGNINSKIGISPKGIIKVFRVLGPAIRNRNYYRQKLKKENIQDAIVYSYWLETSVLFAGKILKDTKIEKKICRTHRWDLYAEESSIGYLPFQKQVIEYLDKVYVISDDGLKYLETIYPEYSHKFSVSRLGTKDFGINPVRSNLNEFVIVSCSFVHKVKRVNLIVEALARIERFEVAVKWIHFGGGQDLNTMKQLAYDKLKGKVDFEFTGQVTNAFILDYYKNHHIDLFVNVSASEGIPVSIMEATSFSIPVIATDVGGTREIVLNNKNGILLNKDFETDELARIISSLIVDADKLNSLRNNSRTIWEVTYFSDSNYRGFYKELLGV